MKQLSLPLPGIGRITCERNKTTTEGVRVALYLSYGFLVFLFCFVFFLLISLQHICILAEEASQILFYLPSA